MICQNVLFEKQDLVIDRINKNNVGFIDYFFSNNGFSSIVQEIAFNYQKNIADISELTSFNIDANICFVQNIYINENKRTLGYGTTMMKDLFQICLFEGIREVYLIAKIQNSNYQLVDFYKKNGFVDLIDLDPNLFLFKKEL